MTVEDVQSFCREYRIPSHLRPRALGKGETARCQNGEMSVYVHTFRASAVRYPLSSFLLSVLERYRVHFLQIHSLGFLRVVHFELACCCLGGMANVTLFRRFYRFCVDGDWFTFEKRWAPAFPPCGGKVLHCLRDWKTRFFFVSERFLPRPLPCRDLKRVIDDPSPPLLDCDRRLYKLLVRNASPALGFLEPLLVMVGMSNLWSKPGQRPAILEDGEVCALFCEVSSIFPFFGPSRCCVHNMVLRLFFVCVMYVSRMMICSYAFAEMNLLKILQKASREMEFVDVDGDTPIPLSSENVMVASPEHSLQEDMSSTDDDITPLSKLLKGKAVVAAEPPKVPTQRVPLRFRLRSHAQTGHPSETSTTELPLVSIKRKASLVPIVEECGEEVCVGESSREKRQEVSSLKLVDEDVVPETPVVPKVVLGISAIASPSEKHVKPVGGPSPGLLLDTEMGSVGAAVTDMDTVVLSRALAFSLKNCFDQGMEAVARLQHRSDVSMRFQQKVASLEDELVKTLEEKKQLLGDIIGLESVRAEAEGYKDELALVVGKMKAVEERARVLNEEVERYAHELQCQHMVNDSIMHDNDCHQEKLRLLEGKVEMAHEFLDEKQAALDSAQDDLMTSRVEVARLQEEVQGLRVEVQRLGVSQRTLVRDREWLVAERCQRVFDRIRGSNMYVQLLGDVNSACLAVGYQNGLLAGYKYAAQGTALKDSPCYDPTAQQWITDSTLALAVATPSILSQLASTPHISLDEFQALTSVVDPNNPGA
ncbi:hypothetical protein E3N88_11743 [Mikania micrantha]|uniref:Transposase (Putative), gypsy type n=1 Tax=Mikania micrantha TaxID=192012 RepID=A0A5N6P3J7_9ASTR|nr:hypothetical protein E3N88_11743 [Mikania micrantha]